MSNKILKKIYLIFLIIFGIFFILWFFWKPPLTSPLTKSGTFEFLDKINPFKSSEQKIVYGFLPYWNLKDITLQKELTHLAYFSLTIGGDGNVITNLDGGTEPGFNKLSSDELELLTTQLKKNNGQLDLVLTMFNNDDIVSLATNPKAHQNLLNSLDSILLAYPFTGVNIDVEYSGEITKKLKTDFTSLVQVINKHLDNKYQNILLSIDVYASSATREQLWEMEKIAKEVDYIIVMAYDFHRRSSIQAGPVAPLFGGKDRWNHDINQYLKDFFAIMPKEKILLGIPFYGYEWQVTSRDPQSLTYPDTGSTASYKRVLKLLENKEEYQVERRWDNTALSPYLTYIEDGNIYMIYYENAKSLAYKLEYVNQLDLAGVAIWALGYEGNGREMWKVVEEML
jgi:spore germination protein YaaH